MEKKSKSESGNRSINLLIENSIALQKVLANLASSLDSLTKDVKKMLGLFEDANKAFADGKRPSMSGTNSGEIRAMNNRLDALVEQNKAMANGIILLENYLRGKPIKEELEEMQEPKKLPQYNY